MFRFSFRLLRYRRGHARQWRRVARRRGSVRSVRSDSLLASRHREVASVHPTFLGPSLWRRRAAPRCGAKKNTNVLCFGVGSGRTSPCRHTRAKQFTKRLTLIEASHAMSCWRFCVWNALARAVAYQRFFFPLPRSIGGPRVVKGVV